MDREEGLLIELLMHKSIIADNRYNDARWWSANSFPFCKEKIFKCS